MRYALYRGAGNCPVPLPRLISKMAAEPEEIRQNMRSSRERGLPEVRLCKPHFVTLSIVGGGPSIAQTYRDIPEGSYIGCVNKAHDWLIERGVIPHACCLLDPLAVLADQVTPRKDVKYFVASCCNPAVFDKLKGYHVELWHASTLSDEASVLGDSDYVLVGGGCTAALRWINLGYLFGFRRFDMFGMDSSYVGKRHHVYEHKQDDEIRTIEVDGYTTHIWMVEQVYHFFDLIERMKDDDYARCEFKVYGDGLLQHCVQKKFESSYFETKSPDPTANSF